MCKVRKGDHAGSKSYSTTYTDDVGHEHHHETSNSENSFSLPPIAMAGGWDESDEWEDEDPE